MQSIVVERSDSALPAAATVEPGLHAVAQLPSEASNAASMTPTAALLGAALPTTTPAAHAADAAYAQLRTTLLQRYSASLRSATR
ncbi:hypothetical protein CKY51_11775 [Xanthomonas maliensis]|nr:hypothetical protein CKY51_11775 [Xanthomonas maliensis]